jgi:hypothetical protein
LRTTGIVFLALGFVMLVAADAITDPTALDANIGAGGLMFIGRPLGGLGLLLIIVDAVLRGMRRRRSAS